MITRVLEISSTDLPNLQILNISLPWTDLSRTQQTITLPKVRILTIEDCSPNFNVPNLDYLCILWYLPVAFDIWPLLRTIDFSQTEHIRVGLHKHMTKGICYPENHIFCRACVSGMTRSSVDCASFERFHEKGMISQAIAIEDNLNLPPKGTFHLPFRYRLKSDAEQIFVLLRQTTDLTELTLDYGSLKHRDCLEYSTLLTEILHSAKTIVRLNLMHARGFVQTCRGLTCGETAPRLEWLTYHNAYRVRTTTFLPRHVKVIQEARVIAASQPLKVLELRNFSVIPSERVKEMEAMGIQVIQL